MKKVQNTTRIAGPMAYVTLCAATVYLLTMTAMATAMEVIIGGYIKVDAIYDLDAD